MLSFAPSLQHYSAIMKYISQPPLLLNVHMHNPTVSVRSWMDSLLAFFPGLQVSARGLSYLLGCSHQRCSATAGLLARLQSLPSAILWLIKLQR